MATRRSITPYLRSAGIDVPYDTMTEAQMNERDKSNPLAGYGFKTATEKVQELQQQMAYKRYLQQQQDQQQQVLMAQMSPQRSIGYNATSILANSLGSLFGKKDAPQAAPDTKDDPEVSRFNELAAEVGPAQAKVMFGQELVQGGNPAGAKMIEDGQAELSKKQKADLDLKNAGLDSQLKQKQIGEVKPNTVVNMSATVDGKPVTKNMEVIGKDDQGRNMYREVSQGLKGSVTGPNDSFSNTKGGIDQRLQDVDNSIIAGATFFDGADKLDKVRESTPNGGGWSGKLILKADNLYNGLKGLATSMGVDDSLMNTDKYDWSKLDKTAQGSAKTRAMILELAAMKAKSIEQGGKTLSDGDIQRQIDTLGGDLTNPKMAGSVLQQAREMVYANVENKLKYTTINGQPVLSNPDYQAKLAQLRARVFKDSPNGAGTVRMTRGSKTYNIPADKVDEAVKDGLTRAD
jgi:hypothetical protein